VTTFTALVQLMSLVQQDFFSGHILKTKTNSNKTHRKNKKPPNSTLTELRGHR